jgi:hypothetical protein
MSMPVLLVAVRSRAMRPAEKFPAPTIGVVLVGTTSNPAMYAGEWLAAIPIRFQVEGGPELRAAVAAVAERLTAALGAAPDNERVPRARSRARRAGSIRL